MKVVLSIFLLLCCLAPWGRADTGFAMDRESTARVAEDAPTPGTLPPGDESVRDVEDLCRMAGDDCERGRTARDGRARSEYFQHAEILAEKAIETSPQSGEGYKWLAIALAAQVEEAPVETQIRLSRRIKDNIEKALALDPDDDISLMVLGRWHYKVASLEPWTRALVKLVYGELPNASLEQAEALLLRAIARKDRIAHRYCLAKVYHHMGKRKAAIEQLRVAVTLPVTFPAEADDAAKARRKLDRWK